MNQVSKGSNSPDGKILLKWSIQAIFNVYVLKKERNLRSLHKLVIFHIIY
jgi:hypothetical protein